MTQQFLVLKDAEGVYRPMVLATPLDGGGEIRAKNVKLEDGDKIVIVEFKEVADYE